MGARKTTEQFIAEAKAVHGNRYDYSHVKYVAGNKPVEIICPKHGTFFQSPDAHLRGQNCPKCSDRQRLGKDTFIERARKVHGNAYDYSKVEYVNNKTKVKIICPVHGEFLQDPHNHLKGKGCPKCAKNAKMTQAEYIERAKMVHNDKYDYSLVHYIKNADKIKIICPDHGIFEQEANSHLMGIGCPYCGREQAKVTMRNTMSRIYGAPCYFKSNAYRSHLDEYVEKGIQTKLANGNVNTSKSEELMYERLVDRFGAQDIVRQYKSDEYPFLCDFYIKSCDLRIELNAHWTHGGHWYDSTKDFEELLEWVRKSKNSDYYRFAIQTWTVRDVKKRIMAVLNHLNYLVFWDTKLRDFDVWMSLDCPLGNDAVNQYSWLSLLEVK